MKTTYLLGAFVLTTSFPHIGHTADVPDGNAPRQGEQLEVGLDVNAAIRLIDRIEPWSDNTSYSKSGWDYLLETARQLQNLTSEQLADALREYQKTWIPRQRWERIVGPFRTGLLTGAAEGTGAGQPTSLAQIQEAYRWYAKNHLGEVALTVQDSRLPLPSPTSGGSPNATKVYLLLRVLFDLPEEVKEDASLNDPPYGFMTAPRFLPRTGHKSWPLSWQNGKPRLVAPFYFHKGAEYNAVKEYRSFLSTYKLRRFSGVIGLPLAIGEMQKGSALLYEEDLKNLRDRDYAELKDTRELIPKLQTFKDPLSKYLRSQFSPDFQKELDTYKYNPWEPEPLHKALAREINRWLKGPLLYTSERFPSSKLSAETQALLAQNPHGADLILLNRFLLAEAYPQHIVRSPLNVARLMKAVGFYAAHAFGNDDPPTLQGVWDAESELKELRGLLDAGTSPNARDNNDSTPLRYAVLSRRLSSVQLLVKRGARIDDEDCEGKTLLIPGYRSIPPELLNFLLDNGANPNAKDHSGMTPLMDAAHYYNTDAIQILLARKADINAQDELGKTALMYVIDQSYISAEDANNIYSAAFALLQAHPDVNIKTIWGKTALSMVQTLKNKQLRTRLSDLLKKAGATQ